MIEKLNKGPIGGFKKNLICQLTVDAPLLDAQFPIFIFYFFLIVIFVLFQRNKQKTVETNEPGIKLDREHMRAEGDAQFLIYTSRLRPNER